MAEPFPVVGLDSDALEAASMLAQNRLPGLIVTDEKGAPYTVLPASQVVRFLVPRYVQDDPSLARVIDESFADKVADKLAGVTVRKLLPERPAELAVLNGEDTVLEVAAMMARLRSPLVVVVEGDRILGAITASRLLELAIPAN
jgi:predicted transcriptional regulator